MDLSNLGEKITKKQKELEQELAGEREYLKKLEILERYAGPDKILDFPTLKAEYEAKAKLINPIKSKLDSLDSLLGGFRPQQLIVLSAPTGAGKTSLLQTMTHTFVRDEIPCLWFSFEVGGLEFLNKFDFSQDMFRAYAPKENTDSNMDWLITRILEGVAKFNTKIVFIDHLHFLVSMEMLAETRSTSLAIGMIMRELKKLAIKTGTTIFLVAHLAKTDDGAPPTLKDLRDSSFIAQEADTVLLLHRIYETDINDPRRKIMTSNAILAVVKNRYSGKTGSLKLQYENNLYKELNNYTNGY